MDDGADATNKSQCKEASCKDENLSIDNFQDDLEESEDGSPYQAVQSYSSNDSYLEGQPRLDETIAQESLLY